jgi:catechol 2,3-dioxygenase-like lactoylglutathione lyase family enzyme/uncharacterized protein YndB with AHSA1/START domain
MTIKRMDNVGIVVENIDSAIEFFTELGLELVGRAPITGDWADGVTGLRDMHVEIAMMRTPDGHSQLELSRFLAPPVVADNRSAPINALGYLRVMFTVEDIDDTLARLGKLGAKIVGAVVQYEDSYRLCYIRGPEEILIGLAQELGQQITRVATAKPDLATRPSQCVIERSMTSPPHAIYKAWTEEFDRWFAAPGTVLMRPEIDAPFFFETHYAGGRHPHYGRFLDLNQDHFVQMTWVTGSAGTEGAETVVSVEIASHGSGSHVRLIHSGFPNQESMERHDKAWVEVLAQQDKVLSGGA